MTDENCGNCGEQAAETLKKKQAEQLEKLEQIIRECNHDDELVTRKVVLKLRQHHIDPTTVVRYMRELLLADLVGMARVRTKAGAPPDVQELDRINALLGALTGTCEAGRLFVAERSDEIRAAFYEYVKENGIMVPDGPLALSKGGGDA